MQWFINMKIAGKLVLSFGLVLLLTVALGGFSLWSMARMDDAADDLSDNWMPSVEAVMQLRVDLGDVRRWELAHLLSADPARMADYEARDGRTLDALKADQARYAALLSSPEEKALYERFSVAKEAFLAEHRQILALSRQMKKDEGRALTLARSAALMTEMSAQLDQLVKLNIDGGKRAGAAANAAYASARLWTWLAMGASVACGMLIALAVARGVARPLEQAIEVARRVAGGDLSAHIAVRSHDETGQLMAALGDMSASLRGLVGQVRSGSDTIATASAEIAAGNQDLSSRTEQQASSLEETASSMEQLTATVRQNADNARQADALAHAASDIALRGGAAVEQVIATMASINTSSRQIVDIIAVIDGIAFQTNILALNAAVEAARAGEQGRGFAVVATEVRNLAQRSAAAAKDIKRLIDTSVEQVAAGSAQVGAAGAAMGDIVSGITRVTDIMAEISAASGEQSLGIEQINEAVAQMDQVTQQNAALVEQAAAAAEAMQEQAQTLSRVVGAFRLEGEPAPASFTAPAPAASWTSARHARADALMLA